MIEPALLDLRTRFEKVCAEFALGGQVDWTDATPRRLVLRASNLEEKQADKEEIVSGPPKSAGSGAARGFATKMGITVEQLSTVVTDKGEYFSFRKQVNGRLTIQILAEQLPSLITGIYFPKTMYWTGKSGPTFIRPIRWIVALLDAEVVPFELAGVESENWTRGHRILGGRGPIAVSIDNYESRLRESHVLVRAAEREQRIRGALDFTVSPDESLLKTLVYLTEWPSTIRGSFDAQFLELPKEILSTVMRHHQRYFSVVREDGSLAPEFVAVTNADGDPEGFIRSGNERVLRARFNDARFFWKVDQHKTLQDRLADLEKVTFQAKLGNYLEKTQRVKALAAEIATKASAGVEAAQRAAELAKCDLTTEMVKEFTELQGVVGGLYARAQGEAEEVAQAIYEHYRPASMEDAIPATVTGQVVSLADKLDTLQQCFRVGLIPSGSKDPFALRRAAQGVIRILFEAKLPVPIFEYCQTDEMAQFLRERISYYLREIKGYPYDEVNALQAASVHTLTDLSDRIEALHTVRPTANFEPLAASFKRIKNILTQAKIEQSAPVDESLLVEGPERDLYVAFDRVRQSIRKSSDYGAKLEDIASLRPQVDLFFDKILVNDPNESIRRNRLSLLHGLLQEFSDIADFSEIVARGAKT